VLTRDNDAKTVWQELPVINISRSAPLIVTVIATVAVALGLLQVAAAKTMQKKPLGAIEQSAGSLESLPKNSQAMPNPVIFMMGTVTFTWTYRQKNAMPFTEHHLITSDDLADALTRNGNGPVRVPTDDSGELLIATIDDSPDLILSARRYTDWTLISVLRNGGDPSSSAGVFKFCSADTDISRCVGSVLQYPDGTVTMTKGSPTVEVADMTRDIDQSSITEKLVALLTL